MNRLLASTRPLRFELLAIGALATLTIVIAGGVSIGLLSFGIPTSCFESGEAACLPFQRAIGRYEALVSAWVPLAILTATILPIGAGFLAGVALVGKEIDQRTTVLAWSLGPSRSRWLLQRLLPIALVLGVYCLVAGGFADLLTGLGSPMIDRTIIDQSHNFDGLGLRGLPTVGGGLLALGLALLVGTVLGRILPSFLVAAAFIVSAVLLISFAHDAVLRSEGVVVESSVQSPGARQLDVLIRTPEGEVISYEEAYRRYGPGFDQVIGDPYIDHEGAEFTQMTLLVPGAAYPVAAARLALIEGAVGLLAICLGFMVVQRRRP